MINLGLIGYGYWGKNYISESRKTKNVAIKKVFSKTSKMSDLPTDIEGTNSLEAILSDRDIPAVIIATPAFTHYELCKAALKADKHVLVEKPFTLNSEDSKELEKIAKDNNKVLMIGHTFLHHEDMAKVFQEITEKKERPLYFYSDRSGPGKIPSDVGSILHLAYHDIYLALNLFGKMPSGIFASAIKNGTNLEDTAEVSLFFPGDMNPSAQIHVSSTEPKKKRDVLIKTDKRIYQFDDLEKEDKLRIFKDYNFPPEYCSGKNISSPLLRQLEFFAEKVKENRGYSNSPEAINVTRVAEACLESVRKKEKINF